MEKDNNLCKECRHDDDVCPARKEMGLDSVGAMFAYAIECNHYVPKLVLVKEANK
ncbi:MAG: hypothetical protein ABFD59_08245 [Smithella sp.]